MTLSELVRKFNAQDKFIAYLEKLWWASKLRLLFVVHSVPENGRIQYDRIATTVTGILAY